VRRRGLVEEQAMVEVQRIDAETYDVSLAGPPRTTHRVTLTDDVRHRLGGDASAERVIVESFRFLLEREPNTSILRSFELSLIGRYFPEYESELRQRLGAG
jgi:hypothetical protein